ncbi:MAG: hypothetical protein EA397_10660 [Deltaproteobacteria bacterium]|nr:MAG: hypothetical protein EA397_10660 [Deltaproteobacteria bacterium]
MTEVQPHTLAAGRYLLVEPIGEGGMAMVYRAFDQRLQVWRAIKVLNPKYAASAKIKERFDFEAQTMALLEHPNIVRVYDVGSVGDVSYIVMELVRGGSLVDWLEQHGAMPPRLALRVTDQICQGIVAAHAKGVIHRDIKPHNVLVTVDGVCRITDFGIARVGNDDGKTKTGSVMGTWGYMAPEQRSDAKNVDERADVYAIAATLFTLVANRIPMDLFAVDRDETMLAGVPQQLLGVLTKATEYHREDRFASVKELRDALLDVRERLPADPSDTPPLVLTRISHLGPPDPELIQRSTPLVEAEAGIMAQSTLMPATGGDRTPMGAIRINEGAVGAAPSEERSFKLLPWLAAFVVLAFGVGMLVVAIGLAWPLLLDAPPATTAKVVDETMVDPAEPVELSTDGVAASSGIPEPDVEPSEGSDPAADPQGSAGPDPAPREDDTRRAPSPPEKPDDAQTSAQPEPTPAPKPAEPPVKPPESPRIVEQAKPEPKQCLEVKEAQGIRVGSRAAFEARLCDEDGSPVTLWYRPAGAQTWQSVGMPLTLGAHRAVLPIDERFADGLDFYIQTTGASHGSRENPRRVGVR